MEIELQQSDEDLITFDLSRLVSLLNALGSIELNDTNDEIYVLGDSAFEVLQDIKNILKEEELTNQRPSLKWLIDKKFIETDLLPILQDHLSNKKISLCVLELLVPLTWPTHHPESQIYHKKLFSNEYHLTNIKSLVLKLFSVEYRKRDDRDQALLRLSILFFRNILRIEDLENTTTTFELEPLHQLVVKTFSKCKIFDLILRITSNLEKKEFYSWNSIILDIFDAIIPDIKDLFESNSEFSKLFSQEVRNNPKLEMTSAMKYKSKIAIVGLQQQVLKSVSGDLNPTLEEVDQLKKKKYRKQKKYSVLLNKSNNTLLYEGNKIVHDIVYRLVYSGVNPLFSTLLRDVQSHKQHCSEETRLYLTKVITKILEFMCYIYKKNLLHLPFGDINWSMISELYTTNFYRFVMVCLQSTSEEKQTFVEYSLISECLAFYIQSLMQLCQDVEFLDIAKSLLSKIFYDERLFQILTSMTRQARLFGFGLIKSCIVLNDSVFRGLEFYKNINHFIFMKTKSKGTERQIDVVVFEKYFANESVLETYLIGLQMPMSSALLHAIIKMLHRILFSQEMLPLIYKMKFLLLLQKSLLQVKNHVIEKEYISLKQIITKISNSIKQHLENNPNHILEFYCTKTKADVERIRIKGIEKPVADVIVTNDQDIPLNEDMSDVQENLANLIVTPSCKQFKVNLLSPSLPLEE